MNKENQDDLINRRVLKGLISNKSIPIKFEEEKRGKWQNSSGVLLSDIYKIIDNAPAVEPCKDCEDRRQAEYIRHGSSWHELQALRKFKEEHERPQGEWIPVSERLPEEKWFNPSGSDFGFDFEEVLCTTIWGNVRPYKYGKPIGHDKAHFWLGGGIMDEYVIAWQYKPEPYKEGDAE